jgi:hypothetical protein
LIVSLTLSVRAWVAGFDCAMSALSSAVKVFATTTTVFANVQRKLIAVLDRLEIAFGVVETFASIGCFPFVSDMVSLTLP